jgi:hypothetical protein
VSGRSALLILRREKLVLLHEPAKLLDASISKRKGLQVVAAADADWAGHDVAGATSRDSAAYWWLDLAAHSVSTWDYHSSAAESFGWGEEVQSVAGSALQETIDRWRRDDFLAEARAVFSNAARNPLAPRAAVAASVRA